MPTVMGVRFVQGLPQQWQIIVTERDGTFLLVTGGNKNEHGTGRGGTRKMINKY